MKNYGILHCSCFSLRLLLAWRIGHERAEWKSAFFINWLDPLDLSKLKKLLDMCCLCPRGTREGKPYFFFEKVICETHYLTDCRNFSWQTFSRKVQLVLAHPSLLAKSCNACEWWPDLVTVILASSCLWSWRKAGLPITLRWSLWMGSLGQGCAMYIVRCIVCVLKFFEKHCTKNRIIKNWKTLYR